MGRVCPAPHRRSSTGGGTPAAESAATDRVEVVARRSESAFYDASGQLAGWADALNTSGDCANPADPPSHVTCLTYTGGLLTKVTKNQTYTTLLGSSLGSASRDVDTTFAYTSSELTSVTDEHNATTSFSHPATGQTQVVPGTPASDTIYTLISPTDALLRISSIKRKLGTSTWIEQETLYDNLDYPTEPTQVTDNKGGTPERVTTYGYQNTGLGLLTRIDELWEGSTGRLTTFAYNANNDLTQRQVMKLDATGAVTTRYCYTSDCTTSGTGPVLLKTVENYIDGTAGGANGHLEDVTTSYQHDAYGQRTRETLAVYAAGGTLLHDRVTGWTYDGFGNVTSEIRNYADGVVGGGYDTTPDPATNARTDLTTVYGYDTAGNRTSVADPRRALGSNLSADDWLTRTTYDALNQPVATRLPTTKDGAACSPDPACREATTTYDEFGLVRSATDHPGLVTATRYDELGRALEQYEQPVGGAPGVTALMSYDAQGRLLTARDREQSKNTAGPHTAYEYDTLGRQTKMTEAAGTASLESVTTFTYDSLDRQLSKEIGSGEPSAQRTTWTYDLGGRVIKTDDEFTCTTTAYDHRDLATTVVEGLNSGTCSGGSPRTITNTYDALGRHTQSSVTGGDVLSAVTFDAGGRELTSSATTGGVTTSSSFTLNALDQVTEEVRSLAGTASSWTRQNYDPAGNATDRCTWNAAPSEWCKPVGTAISPEPAIRTTTTYDARNQRVSLRAPLTGETVYDPAHDYAVAAVYVPTKTNTSGEVTAELQTVYGYDARHRLETVSQQACVVSPDTHTCSGAATAVGANTYTYDDNDNRTSVVESNGAASDTRYYCYDGLNRLVARQTGSACSLVQGAESFDERFAYDDAGNREQVTTTRPAATTDYAYDAEGQLCAAGATTCGSPNVTYDAAGRTQTWSGWTFTYDAHGRLTSACAVAGCASGAMVSYTYDAEGRATEIRSRTQAGALTTRTLRYQGNAPAQELVSGSVVREYVTDEAGSIVKVCDPTCASGTVYVVVWNGHGDATGLWTVDANTGTLTLANSYTYSTWGSPTTYTHNGHPDLGFRYLYVGRHGVTWDELGTGLPLHRMGVRHYAPSLGRFLQPDPTGQEANLYAYGKSSPVSRVDPTGQIAWCGIPVLGWVACTTIARGAAAALLSMIPRAGPALQRGPAIVTAVRANVGRVQSVSATVSRGNIGMGTRVTQAARRTCCGGISGYDAGHLVARILGGPGGQRAGNVAPILTNVNRGAMRIWESQIRSWIERGYQVQIKITLDYADASRVPVAINYSYRVVAPRAPWLTRTFSYRR